MSIPADGPPAPDCAYYWQVALEVGAAEADVVSEALDALGAISISIESANDEDAFDVALPGEPRWRRQRLTALFPGETDSPSLTGRLTAQFPAHSFRLSRLADQDWERAWLAQFAPLKISQRLWVVPSWNAPPDPGAINLVIDPGLAFGTGTHATTRLCLQALDAMDLAGRTVLDYGCGSGILAIAALRLGAAGAVATDLDPRALETTRQNARINGCERTLRTAEPDRIGDVVGSHGADIVIANILAVTLVQLHRELLALLGGNGRILLSGILEDQAADVERAFAHCVRFERRSLDGWVLLEGTRHPVQADG